MDINPPHIYLIFDTIRNQPYYVGQHNGHNKKYITGSKILRRYIKMFGIDSFLKRFDKIILEETTKDSLDIREEYFIQKYKTKTRGGNLTWGGRYDIRIKTPRLKPVIQYTLEGKYVREWEFMKQPVLEGIVNDYNGISACCIGKQKSCGGFIWKYKEGVVSYTIPPKSKHNYPKNRKQTRGIKVVIDGIEYYSKSEVCRKLGIAWSRLNKILDEKS